MGKYRHISNEREQVWSGSDLVSTLTDASECFLFSYSPSMRTLVSWSDNAEQILGVKDISIAREGNLFLRYVHPDDRFLLLSDLEKALIGEKQYRATYRWIRPDNNAVHWLHCRGALHGEGESALFEGMMIDLSEEFTGAVSRLAGPDSVNSVLTAFLEMVFILDKDMRILRLNRPKEVESFNFGDTNFKSELFKIGRPFLECFADMEQRSSFEAMASQILGGQRNHAKTRVFQGVRVFSVEMAPLSEHSVINGVLCLVSDITDTVKVETELAALQRAEGLRLLAAGVAHHFNNSLQSIIGHASLIRTHPTDASMVEKASDAIINIVGRASDLTRQLIIADDNYGTTLSQVDVNLAVMSATNKVNELFSSGFKIAVVFGHVPPVRARHSELAEVVEAILRNAHDSMETTERNGGSTRKSGYLSIKTSVVTLGNQEVGDLRAGQYAKIVIADTGSGMGSEARLRCFEPFFTTKNVDPRTGVSFDGAGLGLSRAFGIIRSFKGNIIAQSERDIGTSISIYLPIEQATVETHADELPINEVRDRANVLIIDDDPLVLRTVHAMLSSLGYACATAESAVQAMSILRQHGEQIKLVLLDALMPGTNPPTLCKKILRLRSDITVVGFSGASDAETTPLLESGALRIIHKPISLEALREVVESAISQKQSVAQ